MDIYQAAKPWHTIAATGENVVILQLPIVTRYITVFGNFIPSFLIPRFLKPRKRACLVFTYSVGSGYIAGRRVAMIIITEWDRFIVARCIFRKQRRSVISSSNCSSVMPSYLINHQPSSSSSVINDCWNHAPQLILCNFTAYSTLGRGRRHVTRMSSNKLRIYINNIIWMQCKKDIRQYSSSYMFGD